MTSNKTLESKSESDISLPRDYLWFPLFEDEVILNPHKERYVSCPFPSIEEEAFWVEKIKKKWESTIAERAQRSERCLAIKKKWESTIAECAQRYERCLVIKKKRESTIAEPTQRSERCGTLSCSRKRPHSEKCNRLISVRENKLRREGNTTEPKFCPQYTESTKGTVAETFPQYSGGQWLQSSVAKKVDTDADSGLVTRFRDLSLAASSSSQAQLFTEGTVAQPYRGGQCLQSSVDKKLDMDAGSGLMTQFHEISLAPSQAQPFDMDTASRLVTRWRLLSLAASSSSKA